MIYIPSPKTEENSDIDSLFIVVLFWVVNLNQEKSVMVYFCWDNNSFQSYGKKLLIEP